MRVALISDVHANGYALEAVLQDAKSQHVERFWCSGDLVGYGPDPIGPLRFLRDRVGPGAWVSGNHEAGLVGRLDTHETGFGAEAIAALELNRVVLRTDGWWDWACARFVRPAADLRTLRAGPAGRDRYLLVHGSPVSPLTDYLRPWEEWKFAMEFQRLADRRQANGWDALVCLIYGQVHIPCLYQLTDGMSQPHRQVLSDRYGEELPLEPGLAILNPGSVGFPRDGDHRPAYAVLDTQRRTVAFRRVEDGYDRRTTARDMRRGGYPDGLCSRLVNAQRNREWPEGWRV